MLHRRHLVVAEVHVDHRDVAGRVGAHERGVVALAVVGDRDALGVLDDVVVGDDVAVSVVDDARAHALALGEGAVDRGDGRQCLGRHGVGDGGVLVGRVDRDLLRGVAAHDLGARGADHAREVEGAREGAGAQQAAEQAHEQGLEGGVRLLLGLLGRGLRRAAAHVARGGRRRPLLRGHFRSLRRRGTVGIVAHDSFFPWRREGGGFPTVEKCTQSPAPVARVATLSPVGHVAFRFLKTPRGHRSARRAPLAPPTRAKGPTWQETGAAGVKRCRLGRARRTSTGRSSRPMRKKGDLAGKSLPSRPFCADPEPNLCQVGPSVQEQRPQGEKDALLGARCGRGSPRRGW